jgi:hypothetical protein
MKSDHVNHTIQPEGTLYVLSFSGFMLTTEEEFDAYTIERSGLSLLFDGPKRAAPPTWRPIPQLTDQNLTTIFPGRNPKSAPLRVAILPNIGDDGKPGLRQVWGDSNPISNLPKDTFLILVSGDDYAERGERAAEEALQAVFVWLRVLTKQWWIGRPSEALTGNVHYGVPLTEGGIVKEQPWASGKGTSPSDGTLRVSSPMWRDVLDRVRMDDTPDPISVLFTDSIYYYFCGDYRTALLLTCAIAELERDRIIEAKGVTKNDLKASDTDILKQLSTGLGRAIGRNMATEAPDAFAFLKACWVARGAVAHGKPLIWVFNGKTTQFTDYPSAEFIGKLESMTKWLKSVP